VLSLNINIFWRANGSIKKKNRILSIENGKDNVPIVEEGAQRRLQLLLSEIVMLMSDDAFCAIEYLLQNIHIYTIFKCNSETITCNSD
jgi:hypothetical protein